MNEKRRQIIEKLLEKINSGEVVTGDRLLPERQLAEAVGETRPVVREGLIALEAMGVLTMADLTAFEGYCQAYARWKEAEAFITQHGSIFQTPSGYVQQVPQVSIAQQNLKIMQSFCSDFGLTPATRARIIAGGGGSEDVSDDPMEKLLKGGWQDD